jgi:hypothetical protein
VFAPDYAAPLVGWRSWLAVWVEGRVRLCSPIYSTLWPPRQATSAVCRATGRWPVPGAAEHAAPQERCRCGIYASDSPLTAAALVSSAHLREPEYRVEQPVFGRVSLRGSVVECEHGFRAACAYPAALYVPALPDETEAPEPPSGWPSLLSEALLARLPRPRTRSCRRRDRLRPAAAPRARLVARALAAYGAPVELIGCETLHQAAKTLEACAST